MNKVFLAAIPVIPALITLMVGGCSDGGMAKEAKKIKIVECSGLSNVEYELADSLASSGVIGDGCYEIAEYPESKMDIRYAAAGAEQGRFSQVLVKAGKMEPAVDCSRGLELVRLCVKEERQ